MGEMLIRKAYTSVTLIKNIRPTSNNLTFKQV